MNNSQDLAKLIKNMAGAKGINEKTMLSDCEISKNALSSMQSGGYFPRLENLAKIADYLDCSVDYLLGRTDNPNSHKAAVSIGDISNVSNNSGIVGSVGSSISPGASDEQAAAILDIYGGLNQVDRAKLLLYADELANKSKQGT